MTKQMIIIKNTFKQQITDLVLAEVFSVYFELESNSLSSIIFNQVS